MPSNDLTRSAASTTQTTAQSFRNTRNRKTEANRQNALKSTGPKTSRGKNNSRVNAVRHGLYSKELLISQADHPEFQSLREGLHGQLKPSTALQNLGFDSFVASVWCSKLAMRIEQQQLSRWLPAECGSVPQEEKADADAGIARWYGYSRSDMKVAAKFLDDAIQEFAETGYFRDDTKASLKRAFREDTLRALEEWIPPMSLNAMYMVEHLERHAKKFGSTEKDAEMSSPAGLPAKLVKDPKQSRQMVCKLLEFRRDVLLELLTIKDRDSLSDGIQTAARYDLSRLHTDMSREMRRALDWFLFLKEKGL